jgi:coniferyl-aldehyde dehydrogenase
MKQEIFGPILSIKPYTHMSEVVDYVNRQPRALALYYFGRDKAEEQYVLNHTISGGVSVNDVIAHITAENLPFGGIGPSGMGAYHGVDGFRNFSHAKSVFRQTRLNVAKMVGQVPPYGARTVKLLAQLIKH